LLAARVTLLPLPATFCALLAESLRSLGTGEHPAMIEAFGVGSLQKNKNHITLNQKENERAETSID
jgi:hypothetical protein